MSKYKAKQSPMTKKYRDYSSDEGEDNDHNRMEDVNLIGNISDSSNLHSRSQNIVRVDLEAAKKSPRRGGNVASNANHSSSAYAVNQITTNVFAPLANGQYHSTKCKNFGILLLVVAIVVLVLITEAVEALEAIVVLTLCLGALSFALAQTLMLLDKDTGTSRMQEVAGFIYQGAQGFFKTQYTAIGGIAIVVSMVLFFGFLYRPVPEGNAGMTPFSMALITSLSFVVGCVCSCPAGYVGLWISVRTNVRVASAARRSYMEAIQVAMQGGIIAAIVVVALVGGLLILYLIFEDIFVGQNNVVSHANEVPILLVGYGFGASFVALFAQLGGGIYTKAADVGADLVGKVEASLPEDDPRNPAVIADLVGDNVGDCAGRGAELFESIAAEIISAMILGGTMATQANVNGTGFVMFPLVIHAFDLVVSSIGYFLVSFAPGEACMMVAPSSARH